MEKLKLSTEKLNSLRNEKETLMKNFNINIEVLNADSKGDCTGCKGTCRHNCVGGFLV